MKSLKTLGAVALLSTSMLGAATSFAASSTDTVQNNNVQTPVKTKFKVADDGGKNEKPENPTGPDDKNPDGNKPLDPNGPFGIAYVPNRLITEHFEGEGETLNESGSQEFAFTNKDVHVGVKDKTHTSGGWTLKAKLDWGSKPLAGSSIVATTDNVKTNLGAEDGGSVKYGSTTDVTSNQSLLINDSESVIMTGKNLATENKVYNNTFDLKLNDAKLRLAETNQIAADTYEGNVTWTLTASPLY